MPQLHWWICCLDCRFYMELGKFEFKEGRFEGPRDSRGNRLNSDWGLRRFLEDHSGHRLSLVNDGDDDDKEGEIAQSNMFKVTPDSHFCMVFQSEDDMFDNAVFPESAIRGESDGRVAVSVLTLYRPEFLYQCLTALMENDTRFTLYLTNQGDTSKSTLKVCDWWKDRPYAEYIFNSPPLFPGAARAKVFQMAHDSGHEYIVTVDDDSTLLPHAIDELVKIADEHPEYHAISGFFTGRRVKYLLGGTKDPKTGKHQNYEYMEGLHEADYISNGFRLIRLDPLVLPDSNYEVGYTDWDYANELEKRGLRMATYGGAGGYHKYLKNIDGEMVPAFNPLRYKVRSRDRTQRMSDYFRGKWGYDPV